MKYLIIEHLEPCISPWLFSEYNYVASLFRERLVFTSVKKNKHKDKLKKIGIVYEGNFLDYIKDKRINDVIILDPKAKRTLKSKEAISTDAIVIGGIMGDHPPKGRTWKLITSLAPFAKSRNLGKGQLTIAGVGYIIKKLEEGFELHDIDLRYGLELSIRLGSHELIIDLPYVFPYENNKPVLPTNYKEVVALRTIYYESKELCLNDEDTE
jgi:ribosome biogenesis SPOUT family RNA methylase Rps3